MTGYTRARGDAAIQLDVDLQDPPELIPTFLEEWRLGADVVYGVRIKRQDWWVLNLQRIVFYRLIDRLSEEKIPVDAGDFRLISRRVMDLLTKPRRRSTLCPGNDRYDGFQPSGDTVQPQCKGSRREQVPIFQACVAGHGRYFESLGGATSSLDLFWIDGVGNHLDFDYWVHVSKADLPVTMAGWICDAGGTRLASISINAMLLGIIGPYLGRMYQQLKKQPLTIIEDVAGVPEGDSF